MVANQPYRNYNVDVLFFSAWLGVLQFAAASSWNQANKKKKKHFW